MTEGNICVLELLLLCSGAWCCKQAGDRSVGFHSFLQSLQSHLREVVFGLSGPN